MSEKQIKDPVHGYISIEENLIPIIDTAAFQRLKRLEQTSCRVLYPGASHDRFIHSLGVYHLGRQAYEAIKANLSDELRTDYLDFIEDLQLPFLVACLLHDIGHAPFSHTLEVFYPIDIFTELQDELSSRLAESYYTNFVRDVGLFPKKPSQHEIMSALMCLSSDELNLPSLFPSGKLEEYLDFIVRAITGYTYHIPDRRPSSRNKEHDCLAIKNSLIRILNAQLIDVDKLDYIIRDSFVSGYRNVEMDLPRLMSAFSLEVNEHKNSNIWPVYRKAALSIIEHVFIARNNQVKWIQSHNAVIYETWLLRRAVKSILSDKLGLGDDNYYAFFKLDALTKQGNSVNGRTWRYLTDDDIISLMKEHYDLPEVYEYFDRRSRKKCIWKTHSDYIATFCSNPDNIIDDLESVYEFFAPFMHESNDYSVRAYSRENIKAIVDNIHATDPALAKKYYNFFGSIGKDLNHPDNFEMLFLSYSTEAWGKQFAPEQIFLKYDSGCISYDNATLASARTINAIPESKGFFIYSNGTRIPTTSVHRAYYEHVNLNTGVDYNI